MALTSSNGTTSAKGLPPFASDWAFFLDVDGTLLELASRPEEVVIRQEHIRTLEQLAQVAAGAVALISGRSIDDLDRLFTPLRLPVAGLHGIERRDFEGRIHHHHQLDGKLDPVRPILTRFADENPGVLLEDKRFSLALHYRQAPDKEALIKTIMQKIMQDIGTDFHLQKGKMVFEIKPSGRDKGVAIEEFLQEPPFIERTPVFIGDDVTDEDGFRIVNEMNGYSIKVGEEETSARWNLANTAMVLEMLTEYISYMNKYQKNQ